MKKSGGLSVGTQIVSFNEIILGDCDWEKNIDEKSKFFEYIASKDDAIIHILKINGFSESITFRKHSQISIGSQVIIYDRNEVEIIDDHDDDKQFWDKT